MTPAEINKKLIRAAKVGDVEGVKAILADGVDVNTWGISALCCAAERGKVEVVKLLLQRGADVNAGNGYALRWAAERCLVEIVRLFLAHGATPKDEETKEKLSEMGFEVFGL